MQEIHNLILQFVFLFFKSNHGVFQIDGRCNSGGPRRVKSINAPGHHPAGRRHHNPPPTHCTLLCILEKAGAASSETRSQALLLAVPRSSNRLQGNKVPSVIRGSKCCFRSSTFPFNIWRNHTLLQDCSSARFLPVSETLCTTKVEVIQVTQ